MLNHPIEGSSSQVSLGSETRKRPFLRYKDRAIVIITFMTLAAVILAVYVVGHDLAQ